MIPFNFDYYLPDTWREAVDILDTLQKQGKSPLYYAGGTEIISMSRVFNIRPDGVIDIKKIPDCVEMGGTGSRLVFGSAVTLNDIGRSGLFPLLSLAGGRIADHTVQCRLTLGGNLAGTIRYHETLLPLLLADSSLFIASPQGVRQVPVAEALSMGKRLPPGELIIRAEVDRAFAKQPYAHIKKSKTEKIGYPLISLAALNAQGTLRLAASGLCEHPFRFCDVPVDNGRLPADTVEMLALSIPEPVADDIEGSAAYRMFIFKRTVEKIIAAFRSGRGIT